MAVLQAHRYGKSRVRVGVLDRTDTPHRYLDLAVEITLEGSQLAPSYTRGDNLRVVPTDTLKNTVYVLARRETFASAEAFALLLARHLIATYSQVERAVVRIEQKEWRPLELAATPRGDAHESAGEQRAVCEVAIDAGGSALLSAGVRALEVLKTARSGFRDFFRDAFTTLPDTDDRLFATIVEATWRYRAESCAPGSTVDWEAERAGIRSALLRAFAEHDSLSVQQTLYAMAEAALAASELVDEVRLVLPNRHHLLADLSAFGLDNPNVIFVPTDEPFGRIEAVVGKGK